MDITSLNSLIEALKTDVTVNKVFISKEKRDKKIDLIIQLCKKNRIVFQMIPAEALKRKAGPKNQGIFAQISPVNFYSLEEIIKQTKTGLILILDGINDTGNLGAIIRTATGAEVKDEPLRAMTLIDGKPALEHTLKYLKKNEYWIVGTDSNQGLAYHKYDYNYKTAIVMGNENKGLGQLIKKNVDQMVYIPHSKKIESLNVSVATAIILFEAIKQKNQ